MAFFLLKTSKCTQALRATTTYEIAVVGNIQRHALIDILFC